MLELGGSELNAFFGERHDAELEVFVDADSLLADFQIVLVNFCVGEAVELLVVDVLVDHLVAEAVRCVVEEHSLELFQQHLEGLFSLYLQGSVMMRLLRQVPCQFGLQRQRHRGQHLIAVLFWFFFLLEEVRVDVVVDHECEIDDIEVLVVRLHLLL